MAADLLVLLAGLAGLAARASAAPTPTAPVSSANLTLDCARQQSLCESELALQAGRVNRNASGQKIPWRDRPGRPVCGSDNATYVNDCALQRAQCEGKTVQELHRGRCEDPTPCWTFLRRTTNRASWVFQPACTAEGLYQPVQCHNETGYCWCMTPRGRAIINTTVKLQAGVPNCSKPPSKIRRGSQGLRPGRGRGQQGQQGRARGRGRGRGRGRRRGRRALCTRAARKHFNRKVLDMLQVDFLHSALGSDRSPGEEDLERRVLEWKFSELDRNGDGEVERSEYSLMRSAVRRVLPNNTCARTFLKRCDLDRDHRISEPEWAACFTREIAHMPPAPIPALDSDGDVVLDEMSGLLLERKDEPEESNCLTDRRAVLDEPRTGKSPLYVPECQADGRYHKLQCYNSTGYCWCVNEDTGKPIPGTSVKDKIPECDVPFPIISPTASPSVNSRSMKGCPEERRIEFLRSLKEFYKLRIQVAKNETESSSSADWDTRIATWSFFTLDHNQNKVLDRKEWKIFRDLVRTHEQLKRCGKRLPRYCDVNMDKSISFTEWRDCLQEPSPGAQVAVTTTLRPKVRKGKNPIESYLKAD